MKLKIPLLKIKPILSYNYRCVHVSIMSEQFVTIIITCFFLSYVQSGLLKSKIIQDHDKALVIIAQGCLKQEKYLNK